MSDETNALNDLILQASEQASERTRKLIGDNGIERLRQAHVLVAGLGGVGSYAVEALARAGVGTLTLIDGDIISVSNINRQLYAFYHTIGQVKTNLASERVKAINPACTVHLQHCWISSENAASFFELRPNWVLDAIDDLPAKAALLATARQLEIPALAVLGTGNRTHPFANFQLSDIAKTHTCPLARALRQRLRRLGIDSGVRVLFSPQSPLKPIDSVEDDVEPPDEGVPMKRRPPGSISYLPGQAGLIAAGVIVEALLAQ